MAVASRHLRRLRPRRLPAPLDVRREVRMTAALVQPEAIGAEETHTNLRTALQALASDPRARQSPGGELVELRVVVDAARIRIDQAAAAGGSMAEARVARVRLMDAAVAG